MCLNNSKLRKIKIFVLAMLFFTFGNIAYALPASIQIPKQTDWVERGTVLTLGPSGSWDDNDPGAFTPAAIVKKGGTYFLYYIGSDRPRTTDGGPAHRALGVATSQDGINFKKYSGNPIITWSPQNNQEEGVFSAAATLDSNGDIVLYWSAITADNPTTESVDSFLRVSTSKDGFNFNDLGYVLLDKGEERGALGTYIAGGKWYVYYFHKSPGWQLRVMSGSSKTSLSNKSGELIGVRDLLDAKSTLIGPDKVAVFVQRGRKSGNNFMEVRTASANSPASLSSIVEKYTFSKSHFTVLLDREKNEWFMYYGNDFGSGGTTKLRTATAVNGGTPPPPPPSSSADINSDGKVDVIDLGILLSNWGASGSADINNDGSVDVVDLGILLSNWS